jgi:hypothetical protein
MLNLNGSANVSCTGTDGKKHHWTKPLAMYEAGDEVMLQVSSGNTTLSCSAFCAQTATLAKRRQSQRQRLRDDPTLRDYFERR